MQKTARIEARTNPDVLALLKRAADLQGRSLSDFVLSAAQGVAQQVIERSDLIILSQRDQERFAAALIDPPEIDLSKTKAHHEKLLGPL